MALFTTSSDSKQAPAGKTLPEELQKALNKVTEISSLPEVTARIVEVVEDPKATARDIHDVVQADPALAAKLLKVVNSAFYGLPSQIASLDRAILMLGLNVVKNLALATSLTRLIKGGNICDQFSTRDLWRHSIAVAVCARQLATRGRALQPDEAFVAGLVHDMGLIVAQQLFAQPVQQVATQCLEQPQNYCAAEEAVLGADHQAFGATLAVRWKFPPGLRHAIGYHHEPSSLQPEFQKITVTTYVADTLCSRGQYGYWLTAQTQEVDDWMLELLKVSPEDIESIQVGLPDAVDEAEGIFSP